MQSKERLRLPGDRDDRAVALTIQLLGGFRVAVQGQPIDPGAWRLRKAGHLVKVLALAEHHQLHREQILDALWPNLDPEAAANNLRVTLHFARKLLDPQPGSPPGAFLLRGEQLILFPERPVWIDVEQFEIAARAAARSTEPVDYEAALDLYAGELLPEDRFEDWVGDKRDALRASYLSLLHNLARVLEERGAWEQAVDVLQRALLEDPTSEPAHMALMRIHALSGRRAQALREYQQLREALQRELDVEPDPEITQLYEAILTGTFTDRDSPLGGEHARRQSLPSRDRPQSLHVLPPRPRTNLPAQLTSFVGREREIASVTQALTQARLLTLTGPGGSGKTRLAIEVAALLLDSYQDGAWLVELAGISDPLLVPQAVASELNVREVPGQALPDTLLSFLRDRQLLLVLDNCEHLIDACLALAETLLRACPLLTILATSREALRAEGEMIWPLKGLTVPDAEAPAALDATRRVDAVQLFADRARLVQPEFRVTHANADAVAAICRQLEGMPLAVELAATRMRGMSAAQIAGRLGDVLQLLTEGRRSGPSRQRSLRAAIDWSYDLLSAAEQRLLARLAVFAGGFTLEAAEAVCAGEDIPPDRILELLFLLVDKSLVLVQEHDGEVRYRLLETIRQYGLERLEAAGERRATEGRHRDWALRLAARAEPELNGPRQSAWLSRLDAEHDNLRIALEWCMTHDIEAGLSLASDLAWFWRVRGSFTEGRTWLERLLERAPEQMPNLARALHSAGMLAAFQGDRRAARPYLEQSLTLNREAADRPGIVRALDNLARVELSDGNRERARALMEECLSVAREIDDVVGISAVLDSLGDLDWVQGDYPSAQARFDESLAVRRAVGDTRGIGWALMKLGNIARIQGDGTRARLLLDESLLNSRQLGNRWDSGWTLSYLGALALTEGEHDGARSLLRESLLVFREVGDRIGSAYCLSFYGALMMLGGAKMHGVQILAAAAAHQNQLGVWLTTDERSLQERVLSAARAGLGEASFAQAWERGRSLTLEQAVAEALAVGTDRA